MAETLSRLRNDLEKRIREIEPLIEEHARLHQALEALKALVGRLRGRVRGCAQARGISRRRRCEGSPWPAAWVGCSRAASPQAGA